MRLNGHTFYYQSSRNIYLHSNRQITTNLYQPLDTMTQVTCLTPTCTHTAYRNSTGQNITSLYQPLDTYDASLEPAPILATALGRIYLICTQSAVRSPSQINLDLIFQHTARFLNCSALKMRIHILNVRLFVREIRGPNQVSQLVIKDQFTCRYMYKS